LSTPQSPTARGKLLFPDFRPGDFSGPIKETCFRIPDRSAYNRLGNPSLVMSFQLQRRLLGKNLTINDASGSILLAEAVSAVSPNLPIVSPSMGRDESRQRI
jgi:hypothetical protein